MAAVSSGTPQRLLYRPTPAAFVLARVLSSFLESSGNKYNAWLVDLRKSNKL